MANKNRSDSRTQSRLHRSRSGRLVLTVPYSGRGWEKAIQRAMREHGLSDWAGATVMTLPEEMI